MKKKLWVISLITLSGIILCFVALNFAVSLIEPRMWYFCKQLPRHKEFKFVDNIENAWWSADGKSLFYRKEVKVILSGWKTKLFRYDVATGKKRVVFSLPDGIYTLDPIRELRDP